MARHYNPWQERFDAVCKKHDDRVKKELIEKGIDPYSYNLGPTFQERFDRVCNK